MAAARAWVALLLLLRSAAVGSASDPAWVVIHTWPWTGCAVSAAAVLSAGGSAVDAVVSGAGAAEADPAIDSVGAGGHPDAAGEPTLDAAVMDGDTSAWGAVGALRGVPSAARAALLVLRHSRHSLLVGSQASDFAASFGGLEARPLRSNASDASHAAWTAAGCQPSYFACTAPPATSGCGPFKPDDGAGPGPPGGGGGAAPPPAPPTVDRGNHDTVAIAALDTRGSLAVATSTNGVAHKLPGRVGDAAVPGAGGYAVTGVGACGATGDGDTMMRFLPCYQAVESLRLGWSPQAAADDAVARVAARAPAFVGALFVLSADGRLHAGAAHGWSFQYTVLRAGDEAPRVFTVNPAAAARPCGRGRLLGRAAALARRAAAALAARLPRGRRALAAASFAAGALAGAGCAAAVRGRAAGGGGLKEVDY